MFQCHLLGNSFLKASQSFQNIISYWIISNLHILQIFFFMSLQYTFSSFNWTYNTYSIFTAFIINLNHSILELFHILFLGTPVQSGRGENNSRFSVVGTKEKESSYSPVYNKYLTSHSSNQRYWDRTSFREPSSYLSKTSPLQRNRLNTSEIV